jgi:trk system potassium uptake protein TrkH
MLIQRLFTSPGRTIIPSMMLLILLGASALAWTPSTFTPISWFDCLFTATSAVCVTGLFTIPLDHFTMLGQTIILCLIQIGALGLITLSIFFWSLFATVGLSTKALTEEAFELNTGQKPIQLAVFSFIFTLCAEFVGFISCFILLKPHYPLSTALFYSLFHAIAAFCSAGITPVPYQTPLFGTRTYNSLLIITALLVLISGLGFVVWREITSYIMSTPKRHRQYFSLHSRLVLTATTIIVSGMAIIIFCTQYYWLFFEHPSFTYIIESICNAITLRSAGFTTLPLGIIFPATMFMIMLASFIGSSPGSTGSGIKVTTIAIFVAAIKSIIFRRDAVEVKNRTIPYDQVFKAIAIFALNSACLAIIIFSLLVTEEHIAPFDIIFEAFCSFTNLGVSRGITPQLSLMGKYIVMISMFIGRIGSLTILFALKGGAKPREFHYPEERIVMG